MPWVDYRKLCDRLDIVEILGWKDWHATVRRGDYLRGSCPLCSTGGSQKGLEFSVNFHRKLFRYFRCKQGGNTLDLWSRYYKTDLPTAANELSKHLRGHPIATRTDRRLWTQRPLER